MPGQAAGLKLTARQWPHKLIFRLVYRWTSRVLLERLRLHDFTSCCLGTGGVPGFSKGYVLYGKEGTLFLDLAAKKLYLTKKGAEGQREEVAIPEDKKEVWRVRDTSSLL